LSKELKSCDGFVVIAPEWHGMAPAGLKNFFLMWTAGGELAHKPALIVTVSISDGGSFPIAELRMSSYKNSRICYLPEHLIIRNVGTVFNDDPEQDNPGAQEYFEDRLRYCLEMLREYSLAFRQIRASGKTSLETYSTGM
jgi:NAD(P)H-dependent FMN reductase